MCRETNFILMLCSTLFVPPPPTPLPLTLTLPLPQVSRVSSTCMRTLIFLVQPKSKKPDSADKDHQQQQPSSSKGDEEMKETEEESPPVQEDEPQEDEQVMFIHSHTCMYAYPQYILTCSHIHTYTQYIYSCVRI